MAEVGSLIGGDALGKWGALYSFFDFTAFWEWRSSGSAQLNLTSSKIVKDPIYLVCII